MRAVVFFAGIALMAVGPIVTLLALSSCFGTILSGHFRACVTDLAFVVFGGVLLIIGFITAVVGAITQDSAVAASATSYRGSSSSPPAEITCKKCGTVYRVDRFFCPSCGQRR